MKYILLILKLILKLMRRGIEDSDLDFVENYTYDYHKHHGLVVKKRIYNKHGLTGLVNMGNKCFINSIVHCLSHTLKLTDYILSNKYKEDINNKHSRFINSYVTLIINIWDNNGLIKPRSFIECTSSYFQKYSDNSQQDSHEFLLNMLDLLHRSFCYEIDMEIRGEVLSESDKLTKQSLEKWYSFYKNEYSVINNIFGGINVNNIHCNNCKHTDNIFEPFLDISLPITETSNNIYECIDNYFCKSEILENRTCEKCKNSSCNKNTTIWSLPNYLIIHLKRFSNSGKKISTNISFPLDNLDLTKYIEPRKDDPSNYIYTLYAVNYHSGNSSGGHYWSACQNIDNTWYILNDENVSKFNLELYSDNAYILFYYRKYIS